MRVRQRGPALWPRTEEREARHCPPRPSHSPAAQHNARAHKAWRGVLSGAACCQARRAVRSGVLSAHTARAPSLHCGRLAMGSASIDVAL
jgi:hypothetical protein